MANKNRHRDGQGPFPIRPNPQPTQPGAVAPVSGSLVFEMLEGTGRVEVPWATDQPGGRLPSQVGNPPPPLATFTDESEPRPEDPGAALSPPASMQTLPHLRKKG